MNVLHNINSLISIYKFVLPAVFRGEPRITDSEVIGSRDSILFTDTSSFLRYTFNCIFPTNPIIRSRFFFFLFLHFFRLAIPLSISRRQLLKANSTGRVRKTWYQDSRAQKKTNFSFLSLILTRNYFYIFSTNPYFTFFFIFISFLADYSHARVRSKNLVATRSLRSSARFFLLASYHRDAGIYESDTEIYESTEYRDLYTHVYNVYTIHMYLSTYDQLRVDRRNRILSVSNPVANFNN